MLLNNAMTLFDPRPGTANSIAPGKRPASSMAHTIVLRDGEVIAVAGAPGGRRILDTVTQVLLSRLVHGRGIQDAVSGPFVDTSTLETAIDDRVPEGVRLALEAQGHRLLQRHEDFFPSYFARPMGISRDPASGSLAGGADPYHTGAAAGSDPRSAELDLPDPLRIDRLQRRQLGLRGRRERLRARTVRDRESGLLLQGGHGHAGHEGLRQQPASRAVEGEDTQGCYQPVHVAGRGDEVHARRPGCAGCVAFARGWYAGRSGRSARCPRRRAAARAGSRMCR